MPVWPQTSCVSAFSACIGSSGKGLALSLGGEAAEGTCAIYTVSRVQEASLECAVGCFSSPPLVSFFRARWLENNVFFHQGL